MKTPEEKTLKGMDKEIVFDWIVRSVREIRLSCYICATAASMFMGCVIGSIIAMIF